MSTLKPRSGIPEILRSFMKNERGMTLPLLAISFLTITGFAGVSVDIARAQLVQSRLSYALDSAGLAAGASMNTADYQAEVDKYLQVNFPTNYLNSSTPTTQVAVSEDKTKISLAAQTTVPTVFMGLFGIHSTTVSATSEISRAVSGLELALVMDNTGSMNSDGRLSSLKSAATTLIDILFGSKESVRNLWVGLVPFSSMVNIGTSHPEWMDTTQYNNTLNWGSYTWGGCVEAELNGFDVQDVPPSIGQLIWKKYNTDAVNSTTFQTGCVVKADGTPYSYSSYGTVYYKCPRIPANFSSYPVNRYCPQEVTPLTGSKTAILTAINSMVAAGNTHTSVGITWGWRMLSPAGAVFGAAR